MDLYTLSFVPSRDVPPVEAAAVDALFIPDAGIVAVSVSPDCSVLAVQHADRIVCYATAGLVEQRRTEPLWTWQLQHGARVRQARLSARMPVLIIAACTAIWARGWHCRVAESETLTSDIRLTRLFRTANVIPGFM